MVSFTRDGRDFFFFFSMKSRVFRVSMKDTRLKEYIEHVLIFSGEVGDTVSCTRWQQLRCAGRCPVDRVFGCILKGDGQTDFECFCTDIDD